jgi:serine O-acetyltransferase
MFDNIRKDYDRHERSLLSLSFWTMVNYRFGRWGLARRTWLARKSTSFLYIISSLFIEITTANNIHRNMVVGEGFHLIHSGCIRLHPDCVIGDRCGIMHEVTMGTNMNDDSPPTVGDDVFIGCGAKILGSIHIGDGARVASNSLVLVDVPAAATAIGVPARIIRYTGRTVPEPAANERAAGDGS